MTRDAIITQLYHSKNFTDCIGKMEPAHLREDLKCEVLAVVCELPESKIMTLHNDKVLEFYVVRVILNMIQSKGNQFARKYRTVSEPYAEHGYFDDGDNKKQHEINVANKSVMLHASCVNELEERETRELLEDAAIDEIENLYWYDKEIVQLYLKHGNYRAIEKETNIPFISCYKTIQKALKAIKEKAVVERPTPLFNKKERVFINNSKASTLNKLINNRS